MLGIVELGDVEPPDLGVGAGALGAALRLLGASEQHLDQLFVFAELLAHVFERGDGDVVGRVEIDQPGVHLLGLLQILGLVLEQARRAEEQALLGLALLLVVSDLDAVGGHAEGFGDSRGIGALLDRGLERHRRVSVRGIGDQGFDALVELRVGELGLFLGDGRAAHGLQRLEQRAGVLRPLLRLLVEHRLDPVVDLLRDPAAWGHAARRRRRLGEVTDRGVDRRRSAEHRLAAQDLVEHAAERVDVAAGIGGDAADLLGRYRLRRAHGREQLGLSGALHARAGAQPVGARVHQDRLLRAVGVAMDQQVFQAQVAVRQAAVVDGAERLEHRAQERARFVDVHRPSP